MPDAEAIDAVAFPEEALAETIGTATAAAAASTTAPATARRRQRGGRALGVDLCGRMMRAIRPGGLGVIAGSISFFTR